VKEGIDLYNVSFVYQSVRLYDCPSLIEFCSKIICEEFDVVHHSESFAAFSVDELRAICMFKADAVAK